MMKYHVCPPKGRRTNYVRLEGVCFDMTTMQNDINIVLYFIVSPFKKVVQSIIN